MRERVHVGVCVCVCVCVRERERGKSRVCNSILRQENVISALAAAATCRQLGELEQPANALSVLTKISIKKKDSETTFTLQS